MDSRDQILKKVTDLMRAKRNIHKTIRNDSCKIKKYVLVTYLPQKRKLLLEYLQCTGNHVYVEMQVTAP